METKWITCMEEEEKGCLDAAGEILRHGGIVAFPTETVYGLGGDALNPISGGKIYEAKGRPSDNPLIVHIHRFESIYRIVADTPKCREMLKTAKKLADAFWPGPLTMILPKAECVPAKTTGGLSTVAVRMPNHKTALALIEKGGGYIAAPSANLSGRPSPTTAQHVKEDMDGRIDCIVDGGAVQIGIESTILDLTADPVMILRPGFITPAMLAKIVGEVDTDITVYASDSGQAPKAPGMKYRHYAPRGELTIVSGEKERVVRYINRALEEAKEAGEKTGVIATQETMDAYIADVVKSTGKKGDEAEAAKRLYGILREFDSEGAKRIYSESFTGEGLGQALMNRLLKAAGHRIIDLEHGNENEGG